MDHVSDSFLETNVPLLVLIEAAKNGNEKEVKEYAQVFREHANKLIEVLQCLLGENLMQPTYRTSDVFIFYPLGYKHFSTAVVNIRLHSASVMFHCC